MTWAVEISEHASVDVQRVLQTTLDEFGERKHNEYSDLIRAGLLELAADPYCRRSKGRDDLQTGIRTLHIGRRGRRARHLLVYRVTGIANVEVVRLLYDGMDLGRHLS